VKRGDRDRAAVHAGRPLGFPNPVLYASRQALNDVAPLPRSEGLVKAFVGFDTHISTFDYNGPGNTLKTAPGLGVPAGEAFLEALSAR
jgi:hypothetical protein